MLIPSNDLSGTLRIGVTETLSAYMLPALLSAITARFPSLQFSLVEYPSPRLCQAIREGMVDLALMLVSNIMLPEDFATEIFIRSTRRLWTCAGHPLQDAPTMALLQIVGGDKLIIPFC